MDCTNAFDDFADPAGKLARGNLAFATKDQKAAAHARNDDALNRDHAGSDQAEPEILHEDEEQRCQGLATEKCRRNEGVSGKAAQRLHLVLDHAGDFRALDPFELGWRKAQDAIDKFKADTAQQSLAEAALIGVDVELEETVDDHEQQEHQAESIQRLHACQRDTREQHDIPDPWQIETDVHEQLRGAWRLEAGALDRAVDDLLGQVEGQEVGNHRDGYDQQNPELLSAGVGPDVAGEAFFHG